MTKLLGFWRSLSGRLLVLTVIFVMLAEILIFVPSVARFREQFLLDKLAKAHIASLSALAASEGPLHPDLEKELLASAGVLSVAVKRERRRELMLASPMREMIGHTYDLRDAGAFELIWDALACAFRFQGRNIGVIGETSHPGGKYMEIVVDERELKAAMLDYGRRIFFLSLFISALTALLVFLSVNQFLVRPIKRVIDSLIRFRDDPEDAGRIIAPSGASGEIGHAERELAEQQKAVAQALKQKSRLAALGEAVAKINHDLRNILASAQLLADRLAESRDPATMRVGGKLVGSLDRAIRLCKQTLAYGRADEPPPEFAEVELAEVASEVAAALNLCETSRRVRGAPNGGGNAERRDAHLRADLALSGGEDRSNVHAGPDQMIAFVNGAPDGMRAVVDPDQLFRALLNLARNAKEAVQSTGRRGVIAIEARRRDDGVEIDVVDNGPGLPQKARENLFKAFKGSVRQGGSGLGMAIAAELIRVQGGELSLVESTGAGVRFRIILPSRGAPSARMAARVAAAKDGARGDADEKEPT
ncbi:MAG: HAMP domain-containing histidine kinase [Neomegalonema sp.]|nr:HAMP domain-containing histidine kinase [Neomegalonema sp.]